MLSRTEKRLKVNVPRVQPQAELREFCLVAIDRDVGGPIGYKTRAPFAL